MAIEQRKVTLEEFLRWPEQKPPLEYFGGVVSQMVSPGLPHAMLQMGFGELVNGFARPRRLGLMLREARARVGGASPVPDLSFYSWARIPRDSAGRPLSYTTEPPELVIEIASPGQTRQALEERCRWFVEQGVPLVLLVWPVGETVTVFGAGLATTVLRGADRIPMGEALVDLDLTVQELFDTAYGRC